MGSQAGPDLRGGLERDGFVIIPGLLNAEQLASLRSVCAHVTAEARAGRWPHVRTVPKQFPPWPSKPGPEGIWGVQHMLHPDLPRPAGTGADVLQASYFSDGVVRAVHEIVRDDSRDGSDSAADPSDGLVMELYNLLVQPEQDFALRWHRDDVPADATAAEEEARLCPKDGQPYRSVHAQWNLALYDDTSLIVVPGSHRRARTAHEFAALKDDPWAPSLPGMLAVQLRAGDAVFYDNNILHRGVYPADVLRCSLHGSMGRRDAASERARNVLQHGVAEWVARCDFGGLEAGVRRRAEGMRERLLRMGGAAGEVGYSQPD